MPRKPKPDLLDHDNPEWTQADFARSRPAATVLPEQFGAEAVADLLKPRCGRQPKRATAKPRSTRA